MAKIQPLQDRVIVKRFESEEKTASGIFYTEICNRNCYLQAGCIILTDQIKKDIRKPGSSFVVI